MYDLYSIQCLPKNEKIDKVEIMYYNGKIILICIMYMVY